MRFGLCADIRNVKEVEELGFDYIEGKLNQIALWSQEEFDEVVKLFESSAIKMETACLLLPKTMVVIGDNYNEEELRSYLDVAFSRMDKLGCKLVVFGSGKSRFIPENMSYQESFVSLIKVTQLMGKIAKEHGIFIAIEPLNKGETNLINTLTEGAALQACVGMNNVGLLADAFHIRKECEDLSHISLCSPLIHTHIALKEGRYFPIEECEEVEEFFNALKSVNYDGRMSIEGKCDDLKSDSIKALKVLRAYA